MAKPLISSRAAQLAGSARVPGDKSISHRALMFGALAVGESTVTGLLEGDDVLRTAACMRALGAEVERLPDGSWRLYGRGVGGLTEPTDVLDMGNSGTGARLLMGLVASHPFTSFFTGDASLRSRPMRRVSDPLSRMGARFVSRDGGRLPMAVVGAERPTPITYELPVASAQVKSAILLAGLNTPGETTVIEREATRDHTELMLRNFGATVRVEAAEGGGLAITVTGYPELTGRAVVVPADPSSAAFPTVAALLVEGSEIRLPGVGINPLRAGLYQTLRDMGADIRFDNTRDQAGEPVADLVVRASRLKGIDVPAERAPSMIDEYPILAVAASFAEGTTRMSGLGELRVKESDRLAAMARGLAACGVAVEETQDTLIVHGTGRIPAGDATIATHFDHRIAMSFLVMGMASARPVAVDDAEAIDTSFPNFVALMNGLGGKIGAAE
ncbi:3-phosphoshikimate 1-carboxyvinyltransferase [Paramagnetospirillum kuznetsovii]|uniref:3-phosphoshikimate 1-carboxyvinyltransferase n=1 Tax=Paramagnetospirillum kuznetsovii TaxID=2053833 RepID=A0A364P1H6_9PROT|nr:3-phosphoshikimate 1-carboxyvinyltransferase [Paramagnetospirillum kuznetsovii]RAU23017.1 3-phosphoshikimate 1-carboxyvinyltransferase [Paramagnetospirillum kuznetsovii]